MAPKHLTAAIGAACVALFITIQMISTSGLPQFSFLRLYYVGNPRVISIPQIPINSILEDVSRTGKGTPYLLGVGKADITGPVVEINMMGYADPKQVGSGLRQRLYSRAFIVADPSIPEDRFVYLVLDTQSGDTAVRYGILEGLQALGPEYATVYGQKNVAVTGTHSHSGPGAWLNYLLPQITSKGFDKQSYQAIVDGTILSVKRAHESIALGYLSFGSIEVQDANINRSPYAYSANPEEERGGYKDDVDKTMTMLKFTRAGDGLSMGMLTWFPVHGTSMLGNNTLISGDNKGVAAYLFEKSVKGLEDCDVDFVAGFSQSNVGDTSPNILGAWCEDESGMPCNFEDSTCGGRNEPCHGRGPFFREKDEGAASCYEIGRRQFSAARTLFNSLDDSTGIPILGPTVRALHTFQDFSSFSFHLPNGTAASTCPAALGYSFAAGTSDGPGAFDFKQNSSGDPTVNPLWGAVRKFLHEPSEEQKLCHAPKPILLDVGEIQKPYLWTPNIVDVQLFRVGQLVIIVSPGEATTMAGRRWKASLSNAATASSLVSPAAPSPLVVLGGPANSYAHYIATEEEYCIQRYEGASTLYGPHTLAAYINLTVSYLPYLADHIPSTPLASGPSPPNNMNASLSFISPVIFDAAPLFRSFGDVVVDTPSAVAPGQTVTVTFVGANPRNNLRSGDSYTAVEKQAGRIWHRVLDDSDWEVSMRWRRTSEVLGTSEVDVVWHIPQDVETGIYRLRYLGEARRITGRVVGFEGVSAKFVVK